MDRAEMDLRFRLKEISYEKELLLGNLKDKKSWSDLKKKVEIDLKERSFAAKARIRQFSEYVERLQREIELLRVSETDISLANSVRIQVLENEIAVYQELLKGKEKVLTDLRGNEFFDIERVIVQEKELILKGLNDLSHEEKGILRTLNKLGERRTGWSARKDRQREYSEAMDEVKSLPKRRMVRIYRVLYYLNSSRKRKT